MSNLYEITDCGTYYLLPDHEINLQEIKIQIM